MNGQGRGIKYTTLLVLFFLLVSSAFLFPHFLSPVQGAGYGCPYKYCSGCWCVNGVCNDLQGCEDECSGSFGDGPGYCCPPPATPTPRPTPTPPPIKPCNANCWFSSQCSTHYCYLNHCRNRNCPEEIDCLCPASPTPTPFPTPTPKKGCNESCLNNGECSTNYCYNGKCRNQACPEETDCDCPPKECNESCNSSRECATGYCYLKRWCRNSRCLEEEDCECPETKMCRYKGCTAVNGQCVWRDFGPILWEAPCPANDCESNADCRNIKLCTWNDCSCPEDYCYRFEGIAIDPSKGCPLDECDEPWSDDLDCGGVCPSPTPTSTPPTSPTPTPTPSPTPSGAEGWFQTEGGDVHSNYESTVGESIISDIPSSALNPFFSLESTESGKFNPYLFLGNPGVVSGSKTNMSFGGGLVSTKGWRIDSYSGQLYTGTPLPRYDYNYFHNTLNLGSNPGACPSGPASGVFKCDSELTIASDWNLAADDEMVVLIEGGDLNVNAQINVPKEAFLAFIVKENININASVGGDVDESDGIGEDEVFIDGVFITDGKISTGDSNKRLVATGIFVAYGGFELERDLEEENETVPAELFLYRPDFVISAPDELKKSAITWQEVAP